MSVSFSTDDYIIPEWSGEPLYNCYFEVIKNGSLVGEIPIKKKSFNLVGRMQDLCDVFIDNPSVSRKHAIIQFMKNDACPYIYDLGGTHGTQINNKNIPARAYEKISPFNSVKFGVSSRIYIFRCPEFEATQNDEEFEAENTFMQAIAEQKKQLSKEKMKEKYLEMLQNDPIYKSNAQSRGLAGSKEAAQKYDGITWGISDQRQVYAYKSQNQFQIQPDVIRRLPGLDQVQLNKITDHQHNLRRYQQVEAELNQLVHKQKRQFGLEEKLRDKKEKLQRKFVQASEALQKTQQWIHVNIFGQQQNRSSKLKKKVKQNDTFEDDEFFDRTIITKRQKKQQKQSIAKDAVFTTKDFWKLEKQLKQKINQLTQLQNQQEKNKQESKINGNAEDQDQLDAFMNENNDKLSKQNTQLISNRILLLKSQIQEIKAELAGSIGQKEIEKIQRKIKGEYNENEEKDEQEEKNKKIKANKMKIDKTLSKLQKIQEQAEEIDQEDVKIFDIYKDEDDDDYKNGKRKRPREIEEAHKQQQSSMNKQRPLQKIVRDMEENDQKEQEYFDLTMLK